MRFVREQYLKLCVWDLEGPISYVDFAADLFRKLESKMNKPELSRFYQMISNYDDYLIENPSTIRTLKVESYEPGDTLRLLAPFYIYYFSEDELVKISRDNPGLVPGSRDIIQKLLETWRVYIISTSYTQHAYNIASEIGLSKESVYCTDFPLNELKKQLGEIDDAIHTLIEVVFPEYLEHGLESVIDDLNTFFFKSKSNYNRVMMKVTVRGGKRKEEAMVQIASRLNYPLNRVVATGDSITDIDMLNRVRKEGGVAVSYNGNQYSLPNANIAVTSPNQMGSYPIYENHDNIWEWLKKWELNYPDFKDNPEKIPRGLISDGTRRYYVENSFVPRIDDLRDLSPADKETVLKEQKDMRRKVRGWVGILG